MPTTTVENKSTDAPEINVSVTFRHTESTPALKTYVTDKLIHILQKYVRNSAEAHVILSVEKRDHTAEIVLHSKPYEATSKATTDDLYSAIDKVVDTLVVQLRKQKERVTDHKVPPTDFETEGA
ncbi:MAG: ribosome-associated translation inhibitor RaiA [Deltaproteobacteria bacterium]|nr:ribosome-associated translation inhibitor RaiA [Deltaproteobacteria bacterium]